MQFDLEALPSSVGEKLLLATIVPRPIAWITTVSPSGVVNAAPFSFFNLMGVDPPIIAIGIQGHGKNRLKDTAENIRSSSEFVVNLVTETTAAAMNVTCIDAPPEIDELRYAGLATAPSAKIAPPRIAVCPVAYECRTETSLSFSPNQSIVIGRVVHAHIDDAYVLDRERSYIDTPKLELVARMHGSGWYTRTKDQFQLQRPVWSDRTPDRT
jgi:flavin reductase (DIM6/NTAB) family NADH-FMN oxidoreductase RutF